MPTETQTAQPVATIPPPQEVAQQEAEQAAQAKLNEQVEQVAKEAKLKAFLALKLNRALNNREITSTSGGVITIDDTEIQSMFMARVHATPEHSESTGQYTMPNPKLAEHEELLSTILAEYGWKGRVTESEQGTGYSMSTRSEGSRTIFSLCIRPMKRS